MAALTRDAIRKSRGMLMYKTLPIASGQTIHVGGLVAVSTATGGDEEAYKATDAANRRIAGVATSVDTERGLVTVAYGGEFEFDIASGAQDVLNLGLNLEVVDDNTVGAGTTAAVLVGELRSFSNAAQTKGWVAVRQFARADIA